MVVISIPFVWAGVSMTLRRLRSANLPAGFVVLFFAPFLNLVFFAILSLIPERDVDALPHDTKRGTGPLPSLVPSDPLGSAAIAALLTGIVGGLAPTSECNRSESMVGACSWRCPSAWVWRPS